MGWGEPTGPVLPAAVEDGMAPLADEITARPRPIEVAAYAHLEKVTAQRDVLAAAVESVAEGECSSMDSRSGCTPDSIDGLCEVCTCRHALAHARLFGELGQ